MLYAIVALLVIVLDQWTKLWIFTNVGEHDTKVLFDGFVSLVNVKNEGGAFSFLADMNVTVVFIAAAGIVALLTIILLATNLVRGGLGRWSLVFIAAGGLSNAIDRLLNDGAVLDMIKLDFLAKRGINFPYFNVADIFITVFSFLLILYVLFGGRKRSAVEEDDEEEEDEEEDEAPEEELPDDEEEDQPRRKSRRERRKEPEPEAEPEPEEEKEQPRKKSRQSYEEDYERYKARKSQEPPAEAPAAPKVDPEDPFAEWERANQKQVEAASAPAPAPAPAPVEEAPAPAPAPVEEAPRPRKAAPRPAPEPAPAPEEFSLDDILAEFK